MDALIQDVLQYSRVLRAPLDLHPVDVEKVVNGVIQDYPALQPPNADIELRKPLLPVVGHEAFLTQCVSNLLGNAVKFVTPGQKPHVCEETRAKNSEVEIWFEDNGVGIEPEDQKRVFGIFQRGVRAGRTEGTGIGLAIVKKAVERMGGSVGVESSPGRGTRFWLRLPAAPNGAA
jgi:signal transduction histidine kinase